MSNKKGRPPGAQNISGVVTVQADRCKMCDSTRRAPYTNATVHDYPGIDETTGKPYTATVWRNTNCLDCGQRRRVREHRYEPTIDLVQEALQRESEADIETQDAG